MKDTLSPEHTPCSTAYITPDIELSLFAPLSVPPALAKKPTPLTKIHVEQSPINPQSKIKKITIMVTLTEISYFNTMSSGVLSSALPRIVDNIELAEGFLLWPVLIYALSTGCLILIFETVAVVVDTNFVWVTGSFLYVTFTVVVGLSRTDVQIILFRAFLDIAVAMYLPIAISLITNTSLKANGVTLPLLLTVWASY